MNTKQNLSIIRKALFSLLKMDYAAEIYNNTESVFRVSFYHLSSCYNAFCTASKAQANGPWNTPYTEWQYASENKRAETLCTRIVTAGTRIFEKSGSWEPVEREFSYFEPLFAAVFNAKYCRERELYAMYFLRAEDIA